MNLRIGFSLGGWTWGRSRAIDPDAPVGLATLERLAAPDIFAGVGKVLSRQVRAAMIFWDERGAPAPFPYEAAQIRILS